MILRKQTWRDILWIVLRLSTLICLSGGRWREWSDDVNKARWNWMERAGMTINYQFNWYDRKRTEFVWVLFRVLWLYCLSLSCLTTWWVNSLRWWSHPQMISPVRVTTLPWGWVLSLLLSPVSWLEMHIVNVPKVVSHVGVRVGED